MEGYRVGLLVGYGLLRMLPFAITTYLLLGITTKQQNGEGIYNKFHKCIVVLLGLGINGVAFWGMHYLHYGNFTILGYIKNVWGLNFYHQDVEYFALSLFFAVLISSCTGVLLRMFFVERNCVWTFTKRQEYVLLICCCVAFIVLLMGIGAKDYFQSKIVLYEIAGNNQSVTVNEELSNCDYIELKNTGILPCQIEDLYLSDDEYDLLKLPLTGRVVLADNILLIPCREGTDSFAINKKGETIYLSDGKGRVLESVFFDELDIDTSFRKIGDNPAKWELGSGSPGADNEQKPANYVEMPKLSHESGFYADSFELDLIADENVTVYYTLDGRVPDEGSYLYEGPITVYDKSSEPNVWRSIQNVVPDWKNYTPDTRPVTKAFIVRALAVDNEGNKSDVVTASYFIDCEKYKDKNVISLISDPYGLFENVLGIYVTGNAYDDWYLNGQEGEMPTPLFKMSGMESEREAVFEMFCNLESVVQQDVGIRIQGASAREARNKRFSVYARNIYSGSNRLDLSVFQRNTQPHSVVLRDVFADVICQDLMSNRDIPMQQGEDIRLFLNGEFWYDSYLREKYSSQYFEDYYGIDEEQLILFKNGTLDEGVETDSLLYDELYRFVEEEDFTKEEIYEEFCEMMDVSSYIDFLVANIYCANMDMDDIKNVVLWRSREECDDAYADAKWRLALYDMDAIEWIEHEYYGITDSAEINSFAEKPQYAASAYNQGVIYQALYHSDKFRKQFVNTFMDLMNENFSLDNVSEKLKKYDRDISWLNSFFIKRPEYMKKYLAEEFRLTGSIENVILNNDMHEAGKISINTITPVMEGGSWSGEYFTDYPITVTAQPNAGYRFVRWSGALESADKTIEVTVGAGGIELTAEFEKE